MTRGRLLLVTCLAGLTGCQGAVPTHPARPPGSVVPSAAAPASTSASPAPFERVPFAYGPSSRLAVFNRASMDVQLYPGAGTGLENLSEYAPDRFVGDDRRDIWLIDPSKEERLKLVDGREVGGYAFAPSLDARDTLYFLGSERPDLSDARAFVKVAPSGARPPSLLAPYLGKAGLVVPIAALAAAHGGITSLGVDGPGSAVVFTTGDGGLYLHFPKTRSVQAVLATWALAERGAADGANIDPVWGRFLVWADTRRRGLWILDRQTGGLDPVPYSRLGLVAADSPQFYGDDPFEIVFTGTFPDGSTRLLAYDLRTERLEMLTTLNLLRSGTGSP